MLHKEPNLKLLRCAADQYLSSVGDVTIYDVADSEIVAAVSLQRTITPHEVYENLDDDTLVGEVMHLYNVLVELVQ